MFNARHSNWISPQWRPWKVFIRFRQVRKEPTIRHRHRQHWCLWPWRGPGLGSHADPPNENHRVKICREKRNCSSASKKLVHLPEVLRPGVSLWRCLEKQLQFSQYIRWNKIYLNPLLNLQYANVYYQCFRCIGLIWKVLLGGVLSTPSRPWALDHLFHLWARCFVIDLVHSHCAHR